MCSRSETLPHWQFPLGLASQLLTGFCYGQGRYCFTVLPFGCSSAVCLVQELLDVLVDYCRIKYRIWCIHYIDDTGSPKKLRNGKVYPNYVRDLFEYVGLIVNPKKSYHGAVVDLLGLRLDLLASTVMICPKTVVKTQTKLGLHYTLVGQIGLFYHVDDLEALLGSLNFLSDSYFSQVWWIWKSLITSRSSNTYSTLPSLASSFWHRIRAILRKMSGV